MGCSQSKIENEEAVARCKDRKHFMKDSVSYRNAFAAAHSSYAMSLKNTGAALSDYAQAELPHHHTTGGSPDGPPPSSSIPAPAPPPPLPDASEFTPPPPLSSVLPPPPPDLGFQPLQRAASMPEIKIQKKAAAAMPGPTTINEEEDEDGEIEFEAHSNEKLVRKQRSSRGTNSSRRDDLNQNHIRSSSASTSNDRVVRDPQQQPHHQEAAWEYFFGVDNIPGPTLADSTQVKKPVEEEEVAEKVEEEEEEEVEEEEVEVEERVEKKLEKKVEVEVAVPLPPMPVVERKVERGRRMGKGANLMQVFVDLDDHFLKASESAHEVSKMLEATRLHYHSNFADNRGHIDHSARVMRVITWNRSFRGIPNMDDGKDDFDTEENETHATVLDKMLAWEKKLYDEVKAGELMKFEYGRKVNALNKQKKRGANPDSLEKLKAVVSHLHTRYIVDMQSMDSTVAEINRLRDEQLYPKLVQLVDGMATMWDAMRVHHEAQAKIVNVLRSLDISQAPMDTSEHHHDRTFQLLVVVQEWHSQFCKLIDNQKSYIKALNNWLKLNLIPIESSLKEKVSSPPRIQSPPIQKLLTSWLEFLDRLPDEVARNSINAFAAVVHTILQQQEEEMKLKERCEDTKKELTRKKRQLDDFYNKHMQRRTPEELDADGAENSAYKDAMTVRQFAVDSVQKRLEDEEEAYEKQCLQVREKSLASLKTRLPELFKDLSDIARACSEMYRNLRSISQQQHRNPK